MKKTVLKLSAIALSVILLGGCKVAEPEVNLDPAGKVIDKGNRTQYSSVLERTNDMIRIFKGYPLGIIVDSIENRTAATAQLPADITDIVKTSFNRIGNYVTVVYDDGSAALKELPEIYTINGAITEYDVVSAKDNTVEAAGTGTVGKHHERWDAQGGLGQEDETIKIAINFNPSDWRHSNYVPRTSTSNKVTVEKKSNSNEFAFAILGSGFGFNNAVTKSQGVHASLVVLVELSVAEVLGKLGKFPYWLLSDGGIVNRDVVNQLSAEFIREPLNKRIEKISYLLYLKGKNVQTTTLMNDQLRQAILEYKSEHGMKTDETLSSQFYLSLLGA